MTQATVSSLPYTPQPNLLRAANTVHLLTLALAATLALALTGCGGLQQAIRPLAGPSGFQGKVHGGQQPVVGSLVQLIAPGTSGYGSAGTVLTSASTSASGAFVFPSTYTCPANNPLVYVLATGGNAGGGLNSSIAEAAVLGPCSTLTPSTFVQITEVTTVAAAYALAPFSNVSGGATNVGTSSSNLLGLMNAAGAAANLASISTGVVPAAGSVPGVVAPAAEINTLADILASCVNSGANGGASTCSALFSAATPTGASAPTDTFQAAVDIALNPGRNIATLYGLAASSAPYQPSLTSAPTDFAVGLVFNGGVIAASNGTHGVDVDAQGNVWTVAAGSTRNGMPRGVVEISPAGAYLSPASGYLNGRTGGLDVPQALVINGAGNVEIASLNNNQVFEITSSGGTNGPFAVSTAASFNAPIGLAIDNRDFSSWVTDYNANTVTHLNVSGAELTPANPMAVGSLPQGVAIDGSANIWIADSDANNGANSGLTKLTPGTGSTYTSQFFSTGVNTTPFDVAIDNTGNVWSTQYNGVGKNSTTGAQLSPSGGFLSNLDNSPFSIAIDGLGRAFVSNSSHATNNPGTLTVYSATGTLLSTSNSNYGYSAGGILPATVWAPKGLALDSSGNCWIAGSGPNVLVELVGIAAPVLTPLSVANSPNMLGVRP